MGSWVKEAVSPAAYVNLTFVWRTKVRQDGASWVVDVVHTAGNVEQLDLSFPTQAEAEEALRVLVHGFDPS